MVAECTLNLRLIHRNNRAPRMRKPTTIPPTIPPIAPPERPPEEAGLVFAAGSAVGEGKDDVEEAAMAVEGLADVSRTVIVSNVNGLLVSVVAKEVATPVTVVAANVVAGVLSA